MRRSGGRGPNGRRPFWAKKDGSQVRKKKENGKPTPPPPPGSYKAATTINIGDGCDGVKTRTSIKTDKEKRQSKEEKTPGLKKKRNTLLLRDK